jgi:hypothetical protein
LVSHLTDRDWGQYQLHKDAEWNIIDPLSKGDAFKDHQWMPDTMDSAEPNTHTYMYFFTYMSMIKFNE